MNKFRQEDISHIPKRYQQHTVGNSNEESTPQVQTAAPIGFPTLESAISYYEKNAQGDFAKLFSATAVWLREYRQMKSEKHREPRE